MSLPTSTTPTMIGQEIHLPITIPKPATEVELPGYPAVPSMNSPTFKALAQSIADSGQLHPIHIDENDMVWDGRTRLAVMLHLKLPTIKAIRIYSGDGRRIAREALKYRQWRPSEYAEYIYRLHSVDGIGSGGESKEMFKVISAWLETTLGWTIGFKSKNVQKYYAVGKRIDFLTHYVPGLDNTNPIDPAQQLKDLRAADSINRADKVRSKQEPPKQTKNNSAVSKARRGLAVAGSALPVISKADIIKNPEIALVMQQVYEHLQRVVQADDFADAVSKGQKIADEQALKLAARKPRKAKTTGTGGVVSFTPSIPTPTGVADALAAAQAAPSSTAKTEDETLTLANEVSTLDA